MTKLKLAAVAIFILLSTLAGGLFTYRFMGLGHSGVAYVSDNPNLTDDSGFRFYGLGDDYFQAAGIKMAWVQDLSIATLIDRAHGTSPILFRCRIDKPHRRLFTHKMKKLSWPLEKTLAQIERYSPFGHVGEKFPFNSVGWWPPPKEAAAHITTYKGKMQWSQDGDKGRDYYAFVDDLNGWCYGLYWWV